WNRVEPGRVVDGALLLKGEKQVNHIEVGGLAIEVPGASGPYGPLPHLPSGNQRLIASLFGFGLLALVITTFNGTRRFSLAVAALTGVIVFLCVSWTAGLGGGPVSPAGAVGYASYTGVNKSRDTYVLLILTIAPAAVVLLFSKIHRKLTVTCLRL